MKPQTPLPLITEVRLLTSELAGACHVMSTPPAPAELLPLAVVPDPLRAPEPVPKTASAAKREEPALGAMTWEKVYSAKMMKLATRTRDLIQAAGEASGLRGKQGEEAMPLFICIYGFNFFRQGHLR